MKAGTPLAVVAAVLLSACGGTTGTPQDPTPDGNDTFATAQAVTVGVATTGVISSATDDDWFRFTIAGPGTVTVTLSALSADADLELYDSAQVRVSASSNAGTATDTVTWVAAAADTFRVHVLPVVAGASYSLAAAFTAAAVPDGNDTFATAQPLALDTPTAGVISTATDDDWYKLTVTGAGAITVTLSALSADANLALHDAAEALLGSSSGAGTADEAITWTASGAGTFYVRVIPVTVGASYTLTAGFVAAGTGDGNDTFATAQLAALDTPTAGVISSATDDDWYKFTVTGAGAITVTLSALSADANLSLHDAAQALLGTASGAGTANETITWMASGPATFYVRVIPVTVGATYSLRAGFVGGAVVDGNDTFATAQAATVGSSLIGIVSSSTDNDWYRFTTSAAGTVTVTLSGLSAGADLELYGSLPNLMVDGSYFAGTQVDTVTYTATAAATYHVKVIPTGAVTPYTLSLSFTP